MPRIRTVKPEWPQDAKLAKVSREVRYTFFLLLTQADDQGYFRAAPRTLLGALYPHDPDVTERILTKELDSLLNLGLLRCFDSEDGIIGQIAKFADHQKIDHPSKPILAKASRKPRDSFAKGVLTLDLVPVPVPITPTAIAPAPSDGDFDAAWSRYPKRAGGNPRTDALKAWNARIAEGVSVADMVAGLERYVAYLAATGNLGTQYVMQAARFFGPSRQWAEPWQAPAAPAGKLTQREKNLEVLSAIVAEEEAA